MIQSERDFVASSATVSREQTSPLTLDPVNLTQVEAPSPLRLVDDPLPLRTADKGGTRNPAPSDPFVVVDAIGCTAPVVLLRLRRALAEVPKGEELLLHADRTDIGGELAALVRVAGVVVSDGDAPGSFRIRKV